MFHSWSLLAISFACLFSKHHLDIIAYLHEENRVLEAQLKAALGHHRIPLNDDQRRRLAVLAKNIPRNVLNRIATMVIPDTLLRWFRQLVALKYTAKPHQSGRPCISDELVQLLLQMALQNPTWGYARIQGALKNLGYSLPKSTVGRVFRNHGIEPSPSRKERTTWAAFLKAHWSMITATDFFTIEIFTPSGLTRYHVLFVIDLATRIVHFAGLCPEPNGSWMAQIARNLTDCFDGFLLNKKFLIHDRASVFDKQFIYVLKTSGVRSIKLPARSPNLNAFSERFCSLNQV